MLTRKSLMNTTRILSVLLFSFLLNPVFVKAQVPSTAAAYPFIASQKTYTPLTGGTPIVFTSNDDGYAQNIPIGFTFPFCTGTYTAIHACTNGWISFNPSSTGTSLSNSSISNISDPALMVLWDDLSVNPGGNVKYLTTGTAPNRVFTIEYSNVQWYYNNSTPYDVIEFQIKLYEGGVIEYLYKQGLDPIYSQASLSATIGIKNSGTTDFQTLVNHTANPPVTLNPTYSYSVNDRPATGQSYLWGQLPCTGTPTTSVVGPNKVCPGKPFTVSLSGLSLFSGFTYQWQDSPNGTAWTNITGATNSSYTGTMTTAKWFRCIVTCTNSSQTYTTAGFYITIAPFYYCYCDQTSISQTGIDIGNVTVHTTPANDTVLNNGIVTSVDNNSSANKGYTDWRYTVDPMPMYHDSTYKFIIQQINSGTFTAGMATIFIDYNRNGTFDDTERILLQPTANVLPNPGLVTGTYKLPDSARYGLTGMRVIINSGNSAPDSCLNTSNGETEDYLVDLRYVPCTAAPLPGVVEGDTSMCIGYDYVLTDTTYEIKKHGIDRIWQISADTISQVTIAGSTNKDTLTRVFDGQPFYYRVLATCSHTNDTSTSPWHKVNIKPSYKCYCHSQSSGTAKDTSDIGAFTLSTLSTSDGGTHLLNPKAFRKRQDRTDLEPLQIDVDSIYNFSIFHTMPYQNHADGKVTVFVDFNNNHKYDIPDERIYTGFTSIGYHVLLNALIIPNNVIVDVPTGMRIIINNDVAPNIPSDEACGEYTSGETEDYILMFKRPFPVGIKEAEGVNQLSLVPNPTSGKFQVQFKGAASQEGVTVRILNVTGQLVKQQVYPHNGGIFRQQVDLGNEAKGMYMVEVISGGQKMIEKLTVR
jgi:hypothetical protein